MKHSRSPAPALALVLAVLAVVGLCLQATAFVQTPGTTIPGIHKPVSNPIKSVHVP